MTPSDEPMLANSSIEIKNSIIYGRVDFNNTVLISRYASRIHYLRKMYPSGTPYLMEMQRLLIPSSRRPETSRDRSSTERQFSADLFQWARILHWLPIWRHYRFLLCSVQINCESQRSSVQGSCRFHRDQFRDYVEFVSSQFAAAAIFDETYFGGDTNFKDSLFSQVAEFNKTQFKNETSFEGAHFVGSALFRTYLQRHDRFNSTQFDKHTCFKQAQFRGPAFFTSAKFNDLVEFIECNFFAGAAFRQSDFRIDTHSITRRFMDLPISYQAISWDLPILVVRSLLTTPISAIPASMVQRTSADQHLAKRSIFMIHSSKITSISRAARLIPLI